MNLRIASFGLFIVSLASVLGCTSRNSRSEDDRFRGMIPTSRTREKEKPIAAKPIERPSDSPPLLAPPMPDERPVVPVDFQKPEIPSAIDASTPPRIIERIRDRREEKREERRNPESTKPDDTPKLPSPYAKDKGTQPPVSGGEFPTPGSTTPAAPKGTTTTPVTTSANQLDQVKKVYQLAKQKWDGMKDYEARLIRREVINGKESPTEEMIFKFRKEPYSVYTKNVGGAGKGREVIYVAGPNAKMHILTGEGDNRLLGAGFYSALAPDDRMVTSKSRHKITEGAVGRTVEMLGKAIAKAEAGQFDGLKSMGLVKRKEYAEAVEGIEATLPPGQDPELPKGGKREVYFDANPQSASYGLPMLIRLLEGDRELEYYAFSQFKVPANFTDADFDPTKLSKRR